MLEEATPNLWRAAATTAATRVSRRCEWGLAERDEQEWGVRLRRRVREGCYVSSASGRKALDREIWNDAQQAATWALSFRGVDEECASIQRGADDGVGPTNERCRKNLEWAKWRLHVLACEEGRSAFDFHLLLAALSFDATLGFFCMQSLPK